MLLRRVLELVPLSLVLGITLAALRHEDLPAIRQAALRTAGKVVVGLVLGCAALQALLLLYQG